MTSIPDILSADKIRLHAQPANRDAAITAVGQLLVGAGHVTPEYIPTMFAREDISTTYLGSGVAIPHGTRDGLAFVRSSGVAILHVPTGVDFGGGNIAQLVFGLAARSDNHLDILTSIAEICSDEEQLLRVLAANSPDEVIAIFNGKRAS